MKKVTKLLVLSQVTLMAPIILCVAIMPHFLFESNEGGMSNYGVHASTIVFYTLALLLSAIFLILASRALGQARDYQLIKTVFVITACSLLLVLITTYPYQHSSTFSNIHTAANIWIFCFETLAGCWVAFIFWRTTTSILLILVQLLAFILLVLTFLGVIHLLFVAQILTMVSFGLLLIMSTTKQD